MGFVRKDHITQHVREVHKRSPEQELGRSPVAESSRRLGGGSVEASATSEKRKRDSELAHLNRDELIGKLSEEREKRRDLKRELESQRQRYDEQTGRLLRIIENQAARERA